MSKTVNGNSASPHCSLGGPLEINVASADQKKDAAIKAVKELFRDTSVSRSTTKELLEQVAEEIETLVSTIDADESDD